MRDVCVCVCRERERAKRKERMRGAGCKPPVLTNGNNLDTTRRGPIDSEGCKGSEHRQAACVGRERTYTYICIHTYIHVYIGAHHRTGTGTDTTRRGPSTRSDARMRCNGSERELRSNSFVCDYVGMRCKGFRSRSQSQRTDQADSERVRSLYIICIYMHIYMSRRRDGTGRFCPRTRAPARPTLDGGGTDLRPRCII
jgi:hypothetical protein